MGHEAHARRADAVGMKLTILISLGLALLFACTAKASATTTYHSATEQRTIVLLNQIRAKHGLHSLRLDGPLSRAAREHSGNLLNRGYFSHDGPDGTFNARLNRYVKRNLVAENIAWGTGGFSTAAGIVSLWMASPEHRHIVLLPQLRRVGLGVAYGTFQSNAGAAMATADFSS
jgi:uncharacterized protein YkwD